MPDPTGFLTAGRVEARARPIAKRVRDWRPVYETPPPALVVRQSSRCMGCGVPFCQSSSGCPLHNAIPDWNDLVHQGRDEEALALLHATNNFPEFTGALCPAPCETACVLDLVAEPVTIRNIEASIIAKGFSRGWVRPSPPARETGRKVAIVGSGPAGLAAAQELRRRGHKVDVYERDDQPGGLLRYGIPDFKFDKAQVDRRLKQISDEGVTFHTGVSLGAGLSLADLRATHDAICLTIGAGQPRDLSLPGRQLSGIVYAMPYLTRQNRLNAGLPDDDPALTAAGKRVVILGGGDTGADCLGTATRQGAASVTQLELLPRPPEERDQSTPWPHWPMRLSHGPAYDENGERLWNIKTTGFCGPAGRVTGLDGVRLDDPGRPFRLAADLVLLAVGFTGPTVAGLDPDLRLDRDGRIATDGNHLTSVPGVYAAGDAHRGASLIVWAIAEGRRMATAIHKNLGGDK